MSEERLKVLEMLANGRVTVEQANQLLATLGLSDGQRDEAESARVGASEPHDTSGAGDQHYGEWTFSQILQMCTVGVEPEYIRKVREAGLGDLTFEQILQMGLQG